MFNLFGIELSISLKNTEGKHRGNNKFVSF